MREFGLAKASERVPAAGRQNAGKGRLKFIDGFADLVYGSEPS
jgi:hypothetical protein